MNSQHEWGFMSSLFFYRMYRLQLKLILARIINTNWGKFSKAIDIGSLEQGMTSCCSLVTPQGWVWKIISLMNEV